MTTTPTEGITECTHDLVIQVPRQHKRRRMVVLPAQTQLAKHVLRRIEVKVEVALPLVKDAIHAQHHGRRRLDRRGPLGLVVRQGVHEVPRGLGLEGEGHLSAPVVDGGDGHHGVAQGR